METSDCSWTRVAGRSRKLRCSAANATKQPLCVVPTRNRPASWHARLLTLHAGLVLPPGGSSGTTASGTTWIYDLNDLYTTPLQFFGSVSLAAATHAIAHLRLRAPRDQRVVCYHRSDRSSQDELNEASSECALGPL